MTSATEPQADCDQVVPEMMGDHLPLDQTPGLLTLVGSDCVGEQAFFVVLTGTLVPEPHLAGAYGAVFAVLWALGRKRQERPL